MSERTLKETSLLILGLDFCYGDFVGVRTGDAG